MSVFYTKLPNEEIIEMFKDHDAIGNEIVFRDKDKIFLPIFGVRWDEN